jgi:hypothetical protein
VCDISWSSVLFVNEGTAYGIFLLGRGDWSIVKLGFQCSQLNVSQPCSCVEMICVSGSLLAGFHLGAFSHSFAQCSLFFNPVSPICS